MKLKRSLSKGVDYRVLSLLADLSQALAISVDIEKTLKQAVSLIAKCMEAEAASVFLLDAEQNCLVCRACFGPVDLVGLSLPSTAGVVGRALHSNAAQIVRDAQSDPDFAGKVDAKTGFTTRSLLCAPLSTAHGPLGVIEVVNKIEGDLFELEDCDVLRALAAPTALAISHAALVKEQIDQTRIRRELQLARKMQRSLLPKDRLSPYPIWGINHPAREISGDFFDFFDLADGRIAFAIGDVSGKGLDASLLMVRTASLLRWAGKDGLEPDLWLKRINQELCATVSGGMFVCAVVGYLVPKTQDVCWANAGFLPPILRDQQGIHQTWPAEAPPLAILPDIDYPVHRANVRHASLYFFSDGATDVRDRQRQTIGIEGVHELFSRYADVPADRRLRAMIRELRRLHLSDDTTLLLIEGDCP
jgi:sigma-B regulation protein RsbU (phosphoserine phosphatase)